MNKIIEDQEGAKQEDTEQEAPPTQQMTPEMAQQMLSQYQEAKKQACSAEIAAVLKKYELALVPEPVIVNGLIQAVIKFVPAM